MDNGNEQLDTVCQNLFEHIVQQLPGSLLVALRRVVQLASKDEMNERLGRGGVCEALCQELTVVDPNDRALRLCGSSTILACSRWAGNIELLVRAGACGILLNALRDFKDDLEVQTTCWLALDIFMLSRDPAGRHKLVSNSLCELLCATMRRHASAEALQSTCCSVMATLVRLENHGHVLGELGACELVCHAMRLHDRVCIQLRALVVIENLCVNPENGQELVNQGACELVCNAMRLHRSEVRIQERGCMAIGSLSLFSADTLGLGGACDLVCRAMRSANDDVKTSGLFATANLSHMSVQNCVWLGEAGACATVCSIMTRFYHHVNIQRNACICIANLAQNHKVNAHLLGEADACQLVCDALETFMGDALLRSSAYIAIQHLASGQPANRRRLETAGACVLVCMDIPQLEIHMGQTALRAISMLAIGDPINAHRLTQAGACEFVLEIIDANPQNREVFPHGYTALLHLGINDKESRRTLVQLRLYPRLMKFIRTNARCAIVQSIGCEFIRATMNDYDDQALVDYLDSMDIRSLVCTAMKIHPGDRNISIQGLSIVESMPGTDEETCKIVCGAVGASLHDCYVHVLAIEALTSLAVASEENTRVLGDAGACELVCKAMRAHNRAYDTQIAGMAAILALAGDSRQNRDRLGVCGACEVVCVAMTRFREAEQLQLLACKVVSALAKNHGKNKSRLGSAGACECVMEATRIMRYELCTSTCSIFCLAITELSLENTDNARFLGDSGACKFVCSSMALSGDDEQLRIDGCLAVHALAGIDADNRRRLGKHGACELVCSSVKGTTDRAMVVAGAAAVFALEQKDERNRKTFLDHRIFDILEDSSRRLFPYTASAEAARKKRRKKAKKRREREAVVTEPTRDGDVSITLIPDEDACEDHYVVSTDTKHGGNGVSRNDVSHEAAADGRDGVSSMAVRGGSSKAAHGARDETSSEAAQEGSEAAQEGSEMTQEVAHGGRDETGSEVKHGGSDKTGTKATQEGSDETLYYGSDKVSSDGIWRDEAGSEAKNESVFDEEQESRDDDEQVPRNTDYYDDAPDRLFCPVTMELMRDAVIAPDGITYSRAGLQSCIDHASQSNQMLRSPVTGVEMIPMYFDNVDMRSQVLEYLEARAHH